MFMQSCRVSERRSGTGRWLSCVTAAAAGVVAIGLSGPHQADAAVLTTATFDTDSYVFVGTNASTADGISVTTAFAPSTPGAYPHFNFGLIEFDVSSLSLTGDKFLRLEISNFTGASQFALVAAGDDFDNYLASADKPGWFETNIRGQATIDSFEVDSASDVVFIDVANIVNDWIGGSATNYGFGLYGLSVAAGATQQDTFDFASSENTSLTGPVLVDVPEPASLMLAASGAMLLLTSRRRVSQVS